MAEKKYIIDTDIGDDIDDAFALTLAHKLYGEDLIGITTVFRNTVQRAQQVTKLFKTLGSSAHISAGVAHPFNEPIHTFVKDSADDPVCQQICQWDSSYECEVNQGAVDYLIDSALKYGKNLTLITIGPMTNVAAAIQKNRQAMLGIDRIVCMGGWFFNNTAGDGLNPAEWNILCDPDAAHIVFSSSIPVYAVGLDVTLQCALDGNILEDFRNSTLEENKLLSLWLDRWFKYFEFEKSVMHDPLAVASTYTDVCSFKKVYIKVVLESDGGKRSCIAVSESAQDGYYAVNCADSVDKDAFYSLIRCKML